MSDCIDRQSAIEAIAKFVPYAICDESTESYTNGLTDAYNLICQLPSAQPEKMQLSTEKTQLSEEDATKDATFDYIDRLTAIDALSQYPFEKVVNCISIIEELPSAQPEQPSEKQDILEYLDTVLHPIVSPDHWNVYSELHDMISMLPPTQPEIIHCCDCIYYDPEHIEKNGVRYEYRDMPKDAFDSLGTGMVNSEYGINVGGRCCRDYNVGYSEDKRVFVSGQNYCGRAGRRQDASSR